MVVGELVQLKQGKLKQILQQEGLGSDWVDNYSFAFIDRALAGGGFRVKLIFKGGTTALSLVVDLAPPEVDEYIEPFKSRTAYIMRRGCDIRRSY